MLLLRGHLHIADELPHSAVAMERILALRGGRRCARWREEQGGGREGGRAGLQREREVRMWGLRWVDWMAARQKTERGMHIIKAKLLKRHEGEKAGVIRNGSGDC